MPTNAGTAAPRNTRSSSLAGRSSDSSLRDEDDDADDYDDDGGRLSELYPRYALFVEEREREKDRKESNFVAASLRSLSRPKNTLETKNDTGNKKQQPLL